MSEPSRRVDASCRPRLSCSRGRPRRGYPVPAASRDRACGAVLRGRLRSSLARARGGPSWRGSEAPVETARKTTPDGLLALPGSYDQIPKPVPQLGPPLPGDLGVPVVEREKSLGVRPSGPSLRPDPEVDASRAERLRPRPAGAAGARGRRVLPDLERSQGRGQARGGQCGSGFANRAGAARPGARSGRAAAQAGFPGSAGRRGDLQPTCLAAAGLALPGDSGDRDRGEPDGRAQLGPAGAREGAGDGEHLRQRHGPGSPDPPGRAPRRKLRQRRRLRPEPGARRLAAHHHAERQLDRPRQSARDRHRRLCRARGRGRRPQLGNSSRAWCCRPCLASAPSSPSARRRATSSGRSGNRRSRASTRPASGSPNGRWTSSRR